MHRQLRSLLLASRDSECLNEAIDPASSPKVWPLLAQSLGGSFKQFRAPFVMLLLFVVATFITVGYGWIGRPGELPVDVDQPIASPTPIDLPRERSVVAKPKVDSNVVARLTRVWRPEWANSSEAVSEWAALKEGQTIELKSGQAEVYFDSGAQLILQGPIRFQVLGPKLAKVFHGDLTARVSEQAKGFSLITSAGKIIDLGTEFGVSVQADGETDLVVFEGIVDLEHAPRERRREQTDIGSGPNYSRLTTGEAVRVKPNGSTQRIVAVDSNRFAWAATGIAANRSKPAVITNVDDTIREPGVGSFYEIVRGGMEEHIRAYVDRPYEWIGLRSASIPEYLHGGDYIRTFNDDKTNKSYEISVTLSRPARLYVLFDIRLEKPEWLQSNFQNTGDVIGLKAPVNTAAKKSSRAAHPSTYQFEVWECIINTPRTVTLGPNTGRPRQSAMFGIAAVAMEPEQSKDATK